MTLSALIVMVLSWGVISFFAVRFFVMVMKIPQKEFKSIKKREEKLF